MKNKTKRVIKEKLLSVGEVLLLVVPIALLVGVLVNSVISSIRRDNPIPPEPEEEHKIITVQQAEEYVGKTLGELCAKYGDYENLEPLSILAGGSVKCNDDYTKNFYKFIVVQVYDNSEDERYKEKLKYCEEAHYSYCDPPIVNVDVYPEDRAREAGIIPR